MSSYDAFGSAFWGRDFGTLRGQHCDVIEAVDSITALQTGLTAVLQLSLSLVAPVVMRIPTKFKRLYDKLDAGLDGVVDDICPASRLEETSGVGDVVHILCTFNLTSALVVETHLLYIGSKHREKTFAAHVHHVPRRNSLPSTQGYVNGNGCYILIGATLPS